MLTLYDRGGTYWEIAVVAGLSRCRIEQIIARERSKRKLARDREDAATKPLRDFPVRLMTLSIRARNCLLHEGILTVGELLRTDPKVLARLPNVGKITLRELATELDRIRKECRETYTAPQ